MKGVRTFCFVDKQLLVREYQTKDGRQDFLRHNRGPHRLLRASVRELCFVALQACIVSETESSGR
ncbi:MAG: hypothetical protein DWH94_10715 [Planctomycetota bacterium]|jgi:hypothetical protein|nr:MAG: hypothetical protein DWH94_10715 [Planctomycetota bacterium]